MSHLAEEYAKACGVKMGEPIINPHYFPILHDKYITIHNDKKVQAKEYDFWPDVVRLLKQHLGDIKIIQIGAYGEDRINGVDDHKPTGSLKQCAYIIQKGLAHIGIDSLPVHLASALDKPVVGIYAHTYASTCCPIWNKKSKSIVIESDRDGQKPSFALQEPVKMINRIKPEQIAQAALDVLGINQTINHKTIFTGNHCKVNCMDVIPTEKTDVVFNAISVRMDLAHNEEVLEHIIQRNEVEVVTKQPISERLLASKRIKKVIYKSDEFDTDFIYLIKKYGIQHGLACIDEKNVEKERARLFDFLINHLDEKAIIKQNKDRFNPDDFNIIKIVSGKKVVCGAKVFESIFDFNDRKNLDDFFLDLDFFSVYINSHE